MATKAISYRFLICLLPILLVILSSCEKEDEEKPKPQACMAFNEYWFVADTIDVQFGNCSSDAVRYEWSFSNNQFSTAPNPLVTFEGKGRYQVVLDAFNEDGDVSQEVGFVNLGDLYRLEEVVVEDSAVLYSKLTSDEFVSELFPYTSEYDSTGVFFSASTSSAYDFPDFIGLMIVLYRDGNLSEFSQIPLLPQQSYSLDLTTNLFIREVSLQSDTDRYPEVLIEGDLKFSLITL